MKRLQREADEEETREYKSLHAKVGKGNGRSGGRAAPKKDRKANNKEKGKEAEPCICENCMSQETYDLYIKEKEKAKEPKYGTAAYLRWVMHKANKGKGEARSVLFVQLQEEGYQLRLEREGKGKEKGQDKGKGAGNGKTSPVPPLGLSLFLACSVGGVPFHINFFVGDGWTARQ